MILLGIDTATNATAVALQRPDGVLAERRDDPSPGSHPGHATRLLEMAAELLGAAGLRWSDIERIAVGLGPGAFTGLRVGIATARGLAQSLSVELVGVSSLRALALAAVREGAIGAPAAGEPGSPDSLLALIDARRGELFAAAYERGGDGSPAELSAAAALAPQALAGMLAGLQRAQPGSPRRWLAVGDGALRHAEHVRAAGVQPAAPDSPLNRVSAAAICALGARAPGAQDPAGVLPDYIRRPDAELGLQGAGAR